MCILQEKLSKKGFEINIYEKGYLSLSINICSPLPAPLSRNTITYMHKKSIGFLAYVVHNCTHESKRGGHTYFLTIIILYYYRMVYYVVWFVLPSMVDFLEIMKSKSNHEANKNGL